jgi:hypothetical protein
MKKLVITALVLLLALAAIGCAAVEKTGEVTPPAQIGNAFEEEFSPHLGGIKLGDSKDQVIEAFGTDYEEDYFDEAFALGEPFVRMLYSNGITVILGTDSNTVLEIETTSPETVTNLGYRVGDKAQEVLDEYRSKYEEPQSRHSDDTLTGWFLINDEYELVIFKFDTDDTLINENVEPDDRIEGIKLTNFKYMD